MSRHKVTYDEDDLLDDYDDDDDYDEYDDYGENDDYAEEDEVIRKAAEEAANKLAKNKKDADKTISSILEKLNGPKSADAGNIKTTYINNSENTDSISILALNPNRLR